MISNDITSYSFWLEDAMKRYSNHIRWPNPLRRNLRGQAQIGFESWISTQCQYRHKSTFKWKIKSGSSGFSYGRGSRSESLFCRARWFFGCLAVTAFDANRPSSNQQGSQDVSRGMILRPLPVVLHQLWFPQSPN
jgi:hypothetical protein